MKIYVSLPITGNDIEEAKEHAATIKQLISTDENEVITPFDVCPDQNQSYARYMGRDIEALLECDAIYLASGWGNSRGCNLEYTAALIYGKHIFTSMILRDSKTILV
mgnify:FL=1